MMIQQINTGIRAKAIQQIFKTTYGLLVSICILMPNYGMAQTDIIGDIRKQQQIPLTSFEGYYQLPNKIAFISFEQQDNILYATQLWDKKNYELIRKDDTHFESKNEGYTIAFLKDSLSDFSQTKILGRIVCQRVLFDPNKVATLSESQLKLFAGTYIMADDNNLKINIKSSAQGLLLTQLWDNKTVSFTPRSELFFLNEDGTFPLTFSFASGKVEKMTCYENDVWIKAD